MWHSKNYPLYSAELTYTIKEGDDPESGKKSRLERIEIEGRIEIIERSHYKLTVKADANVFYADAWMGIENRVVFDHRIVVMADHEMDFESDLSDISSKPYGDMWKRAEAYQRKIKPQVERFMEKLRKEWFTEEGKKRALEWKAIGRCDRMPIPLKIRPEKKATQAVASISYQQMPTQERPPMKSHEFVKRYLEERFKVKGLKVRSTTQGVYVKDKSEELWVALSDEVAEQLRIDVLGSQDFRMRYSSPIIDQFLHRKVGFSKHEEVIAK